MVDRDPRVSRIPAALGSILNIARGCLVQRPITQVAENSSLSFRVQARPNL